MSSTKTMADGHAVVSQEEWIAARQALLQKEKELTRHMDDVSRLRRELPWVRVAKDYVFEGPNGKQTLAELFKGRSQLVVYHFMYGPDWEEGCQGCSFLCDHVDGARQHFEHHDVKFVAVSRAPLAKLEAFKKRMGWGFDWVSSGNNDFNFDYHATYTRQELDSGPVFHNFKMQTMRFEEQPGISVFYKDEDGNVFHTWSGYERAGDILLGTHNYLDLTPKGRNEEGEMGNWMRFHDKYED